MFSRNVDRRSGDEGKKLREIEENMFTKVIKQDVEEELGDWSRMKEQNDHADVKFPRTLSPASVSMKSVRSQPIDVLVLVCICLIVNIYVPWPT